MGILGILLLSIIILGPIYFIFRLITFHGTVFKFIGGIILVSIYCSIN